METRGVSEATTIARGGGLADRYAAARRRLAEDGPELIAFQALYDFRFDDFQLDACRALNAGHGVLLAAPTGSGKTVVGEFAVHLALAELDSDSRDGADIGG